ncbi:MAG: hypothetical protein K2X90_02960 [Candidatus Babeliaceae bacterium]|nr:hypothetical protein [Candidatus Babeliaceae bacterium]
MFSRSIITTIFISVQLALIFFYIYTQSIIIKLTYSFQDTERIFQEVEKRKRTLTQELLQEKESQKLKNYATHELRMKKTRLSDIKDLPLHEQYC